MNEIWNNAQNWELNWHGNCVNSYNEERKQLEYASLIGLKTSPTHRTPYTFDLEGKKILDIGSGPYSLLLKCRNFDAYTTVADPLMSSFPTWVRQRYQEHGLLMASCPAEELDKVLSADKFDEVWFYNVLEHTYNPEKIVKNALALGKIVRVFEWLNTPPNIGHPQTLTQENLDKWLGGVGKITKHQRGNIVATSYSGIFKGDLYEEA